MKVGPGTEDGVAIGPMINMAAIDKIERHVAGRPVEGRDILSRQPCPAATISRPLVLGGATTDMMLARGDLRTRRAPLPL